MSAGGTARIANRHYPTGAGGLSLQVYCMPGMNGVGLLGSGNDSLEAALGVQAANPAVHPVCVGVGKHVLTDGEMILYISAP